MFVSAFACCVVGFDLKECFSCRCCPAVVDCLFTNWEVSGMDVRDNVVGSVCMEEMGFEQERHVEGEV